MACLLVVTVPATRVGRLGDMYDRARMYEAGFAVLVVGSVLCAIAWSAPGRARWGQTLTRSDLISAAGASPGTWLKGPTVRGGAFGGSMGLFS
ncbi:hypothetical protein ABZ826_30460 [Streptomyces sp. NPDC047515]|uniref:hypothetical protein n=1 Tax=Streptomyces sp. NPDC047515 TaxID=3155380 RepID=UPI0034085054